MPRAAALHSPRGWGTLLLSSLPAARSVRISGNRGLCMAIDDHVGALQQQFENEERSSDPVLHHILQLLSVLPLPWPADKAPEAVLQYLHLDRIKKLEMLTSAIAEELRRHENWLETISQGSQER